MSNLRLYIRWRPVSDLSKPEEGVFMFEAEGSPFDEHEALILWSKNKAREVGMRYKEFRRDFIIEYEVLASLT